MIGYLSLPILWLGFYVIGQFIKNISLSVQRYILVIISLSLLFPFCGPKTFLFYVSLGLSIFIAGNMLSNTSNKVIRKITFIVSLIAVVLMIVVFLEWRIYFQKYFLYLPSLSYLGFRGIASLVTAYKRGNIDPSSALMQVFFFPMLFTGPISRIENFEEQKFDYYNVLQRLVWGLAMLIAGHFCNFYVLQITKDSSNLIPFYQFWIGALANSFQIYFSFAGYSHLIIGLGLLAGFKLPENFNNPYLSQSISEFWRRWHMSLSYWIRDYLYIPLGGNRKGINRKCFNLLFAMGICGIWHGLSWNYLLWGLYHGTLLSVESLMVHFGFSNLKNPSSTSTQWFKVVRTFILTSFGWLLFTYPMPEFLIYIKGLIP
jgi:alginate O-acetyltransferase complex protein AlgI